jgi:hypothetical protein
LKTRLSFLRSTSEEEEEEERRGWTGREILSRRRRGRRRRRGWRGREILSRCRQRAGGGRERQMRRRGEATRRMGSG